jgi:hypothetical protein
MAHAPQQVRLQKTLKEGLRRCVYRRWEATVKGAMLITKTTELERMTPSSGTSSGYGRQLRLGCGPAKGHGHERRDVAR